MTVIMRILPRRRSLALLVLLVSLLFSANRLAAARQPDVPPERAALSGAWTVNNVTP